MKRFTAHNEPWGTFLDPKINGPDLLRKQLTRRKEPFKDAVFISSVTDPYQPPEKKYQITRKILKILLEHGVPVSVLTKSELITRDIDLLKRFEKSTIGLSLSTLDDALAKRLEPRATPPTRRLRTLKLLRDHGIYTYAFISPYIPNLSDIHQLTSELSGVIDEIGVEAINPRGGNWLGVERILRRYYPERLNSCRRLVRDGRYWQALEHNVRKYAKQNHIEMMGFYRH